MKIIFTLLFLLFGLITVWMVYIYNDETEFAGEKNDKISEYFIKYDNSQTIKVVSGEKTCQIVDSYVINDKNKMREVLSKIKDNSQPFETINDVNIDNAVDEWVVHNWMYRHWLFMYHTKSVDFKSNKWYTILFYKIFSFIVS